MSDDLKIEKTPIMLEVIPVLIQITGIVALLYLTRGNPTHSVAAIIISSIWLKVSYSDMPQEFGELRVARRLFSTIGEWLNHDDAKGVFDDAHSEFLKLDGTVEDDQYKAVITASGIANSIRGLASVLINGYLIFVVLMFLFD